MKKLIVPSIATIGMLSFFIVVLLSTVFYFAVDDIPIFIVIGLTIIFNFVMLFISPFIQDFIYKILYKLRWYSQEELAKELPGIYEFLKKCTDDKGFKFPKIGIIPDMNPQAFTYGSTRNNGRVVLTKGLLHFLGEDEVKAVIGHELGHIYNLDFIIMTVASTLLQIIYELSRFLRRARSKRGKKNPLPMIGLVAYVFYIIGSYALLYLSRVREYLADRFSAEVTGDPDLLASALFKISYGIVVSPDTKKTVSLLESTRSLGITDVKSAKSQAAYVSNSRSNVEAGGQLNLQEMFPFMVFDVKSPWAWVSEIKSTHPLTAKRILNLSKIKDDKVVSKFKTYLQGIQIDKVKLYFQFLLDYLVSLVPLALTFVGLFFLIFGFPFYVVTFCLGIGLILQILYKYPPVTSKATTIAELMKDVYASPMRGKYVSLDATVIGRGIPGYIFGEDMMVQDSTGIVFVDVKTILGFITNLFFAWKKFKQLLGKSGKAAVYFFRDVSPWTTLKRFETSDQVVRSYPRLGMLAQAIIIMAGGVVLTIVF